MGTLSTLVRLGEHMCTECTERRYWMLLQGWAVYHYWDPTPQLQTLLHSSSGGCWYDGKKGCRRSTWDSWQRTFSQNRISKVNPIPNGKRAEEGGSLPSFILLVHLILLIINPDEHMTMLFFYHKRFSVRPNRPQKPLSSSAAMLVWVLTKSVPSKMHFLTLIPRVTHMLQKLNSIWQKNPIKTSTLIPSPHLDRELSMIFES